MAKQSLSKCLNNLTQDNCLEWDEFLLFSQIQNLAKESTNHDVDKQLKQAFAKIIGEEIPEIKTFVCAARDNLRDSVSQNGSSLAHEFGGNPLLLDEDLVFDASVLPNQKIFFDEKNLLSLSAAQQFVGSIIRSQKKDEEYSEYMPFLLFCNGDTNNEGIYFFCIHQDIAEMNASVSFAKSSSILEDASNSINVDIIKCRGPAPAQNFINGGIKLLEHLANCITFQPHLLDCGGNLPKNSSLSMRSYSEHEIHCAMEINEGCEQSSVNIHCGKVSEFFGINFEKRNTVSISLRPFPGSKASPAYLLYKDLTIVEGLLKVFKDKEVIWAELFKEGEDENKTEDQTTVKKSVADKIKMAINSMNSDRFSLKKAQPKENEEEKEFESGFIELRKFLDFTETMWDLLKYVSSYEELVDCLGIIFKELKHSGALMFWVHEDNKTTLANLVRDSHKSTFSPPLLREYLPFQILTEIGLDKLAREYLNFFVSHHYSTAKKIESFTTINTDSTDIEKLFAKLVGIKKLHHVVELSAQAGQILVDSKSHLIKLVRGALQSYLIEDYEPTKMFPYSLSYKDVKNFVENILPNIWRLSTVGNTTYGKNSATLSWSKQFPFNPILPLPPNNFKGQLENEQKVMYYVTERERHPY